MNRSTGAMLILALAAVPVLGQAEDDEFLRFQQQEQREFEDYAEKTDADFMAFIEADRRAFEEFKGEVEQMWGDYVGSTKKDWVEYGEGLDSRSKVDFEKGEAEVEVVVDGNPEEAEEKLQEAVTRLIQDQGKSSDYEVELPDGQVDEPKQLSEKPILEGQVADAEGKPVDAANAEKFARELIDSGKVKTEKVKGKDGKERVKAVLVFPLVPDHLRKRAKKFEKEVRKQAQRFDLDPALVFAIMHSESHFNPKARSHIPAYGLMQLVPTSGGREAYKYVYKKDEVLPASYFYVPNQNIELGCGYLNWLRTRMFGKVEDDRKALYCVIAAYNTGAGNVSRAMIGKTSVNAAAPVIEGMEADKLYAHLVEKLPYEETRGYLKHVVERMALYVQ